MVLQQPRSLSKAQPRLDATRILGLSSTLALNVIALAMLLMPMTLPAPPAAPVKDLEWNWIEPKKDPPIPPPVVEIRRPTPPTPQTQTRRIETPRPAVSDQVVVDQGTLQADPVVTPPATDVGQPDIAPSGPVAGMQLEYLQASSPNYPRRAILDNLEGVVLLQVLVDVDGKPLQVTIHRSSGHSVLDREAQRHVLRTWMFRPATKDGHPVQATGIVPIDFKLGRG